MSFLRKYATLTVTGTTAIRIPIVKRAVVDFAVGADWSPAAGDVKIAIDGAAPANVTNLPTAVASGNGAYWEFILTAAETTCKSAVVTIVDAATKAIEDQCFIVETFGHASAMFQVDFSDVVRMGLTALPNAAAGATGGMPLPVVRGGTAQAGTVNSITLDAGASATNNIYNGLLVHIISSTGAGQTRTITGYNGTSKIATIDRVFQTAPSNTSVFELLAADSPALNASLQVTSNVARVTIRSGTAQAGSTSTTIKLDSGASATNNLYNADLVTITGGVGAGQTRTIVSYVGSTKVATVDKAWVTTPDATSTFDLYASTTPSVFSDQGVAQAGGATSITLASTASGTNSVYIGSIVTILAGTGAGETKEITAYNGTTKVATVDAAWVANPDTTSVYAVIPTASGTGSTGGVQDVNVVSVGGTPQTSRDLGAVVYPIRKNTAFSNFTFDMVLASDHISPATGKTVTATRSIDGGAYAACTNSATIAEVSVGTYKISFSAADLNGDNVSVKFVASGCDTTTIPLVLQG